MPTDRPAAPGKVTVEMTLGRSVTLSWKEPEDDGGCKIGTYIVEYYRVRDRKYFHKFLDTDYNDCFRLAGKCGLKQRQADAPAQR